MTGLASCALGAGSSSDEMSTGSLPFDICHGMSTRSLPPDKPPTPHPLLSRGHELSSELFDGPTHELMTNHPR